MHVTTKRTRLILLNQKGEIYVLVRHFRDKTKESFPVILFPGGEIENGETSMEALLREVREEIGIDPIDPQFVHKYINTRSLTKNEQAYWPGALLVTNVFDFYKAECPSGKKPKLKELEKFSAAAWILPNEVESFARLCNAEIGDGIEFVIDHLIHDRSL